MLNLEAKHLNKVNFSGSSLKTSIWQPCTAHNSMRIFSKLLDLKIA